MGRRGRVAKAALEEAKAEAIRLAKAHVPIEEITCEVDFTADTVKRWIRQCGEVPSKKQRVIEMAGRPVDEIATEVGLSVRRVQEILQEHRGAPLKPSPTPEQNVERFLTDPEGCRGKRFTRSDPFGLALVKRCSEITDRNPLKGLQKAEPAIQLFEDLVQVFEGKAKQVATCRLLQARGIKAFALSKRSEHKQALRLLNEGLALAVGQCDACVAGYYQRLGKALGDMAYFKAINLAKEHMPPEEIAADWSRALGMADIAIELHKALPGQSHDLLGNGLAHCYLDRAQIKYYAVNPAAAIPDVHSGLDLVDPQKSEKLHQLLMHALAVLLKESPDSEEIKKACATMRGQLAYFGDKKTVQSVVTKWVAGRAEAKVGNTEKAVLLLEHALDIADEMELQEAAAILAHLGEIDPSPRNIVAQIEGLGVGAERSPEWPLESRFEIPKWLMPPLQAGLAALYRAAKSHSAIKIGEEARNLSRTTQTLLTDGGNLVIGRL